MSIEQILAHGTQLHQTGRLGEAERAYREVLASDPRHPHALHQLGILAMQAGRFDVAADLIAQAIRSDRAQPAFFANLAEAQRHAGRTAEAMDNYRRALQLNPKLPMAQVQLGTLLFEAGKLDEAATLLRDALRSRPDDSPARLQLGMVLEAQGKHSEAETCFRRVVRDQPTAHSHFCLASVLHARGNIDEAEAGYRAALALEPSHVDVHNNLGTLYFNRGQSADAERHFRAVLAAEPRSATAYANLGLLRFVEKKFGDAADHYAVAVQLDPTLARAWSGFGAACQKLGKYAEAEQHFARALECDPALADAHLSLAYLYERAGSLKKAVESCEAALRLRPDWADAYSNLTVAWAEQGRHDEAIAAAQNAVRLNPNFAQAYGNLAVSLQSLGRLDEALVAHRRAIECDPHDSGLHSNLLYALNYPSGLDPATIFAEHRAWGRRHADPLTAVSPPHELDRSPQRRLRVGYVSPHFCAHAVNFFTQPILESHDHTQFEIYCYFDAEQADQVTVQLQPHADVWRNVAHLDDAALAEQIRADRIDILVDLTGHISGGRRMLVFARKPAPIQVTYIGYQNTTGMQAMDYRLTDDYADPPGTTDAWHTEHLVRLPVSFFCYRPDADAPEVGPLPAAANGYVTFGSVNAFAKVTPQVLDTWAEILLGVPNSRLVLRADMTESLRARLSAFFASRGIAAERLELIDRLPRPEYLKLISRLDIALDPFPFNGHTTTCDSLWQGVPVITLSGRTYVERFGGSGLHTLGLGELIADSPHAYREIAIRLAGDRARLAEFRAGLRKRMADSPLLNFAGFTRNLETAYRDMWLRYCESTGP